VHADDAQRLVGDALEAMRRLGRDDDDVPRLDLELLVADGEAGGPCLDQEDLGIGMEVKRDALALLVLDDEDRGVDLVAALEQRRRRAEPQVVEGDDGRDR
jgi:hypothetical protein